MGYARNGMPYFLRFCAMLMYEEGMQMSNFVEKVLVINIEHLLLTYLLLCTMRV